MSAVSRPVPRVRARRRDRPPGRMPGERLRGHMAQHGARRRRRRLEEVGKV
jgi:hypothetical protein